jgi:two-component system sensor histidine kinase YesM
VLQPLIENSIAHGIKDMGSNGIINVTVSRDGDKLVFIVEDNGCGVDNEEIERLLNEDGDGNRGFAIKNVNDRIKLYFGESYGLEFFGSEDGTTVIVTQPYCREEPGNNEDTAD